MLKTISDKLLSLWPNNTNNTNIVSTGCKRKRFNDECDTVSDLHEQRLEKRRKTEASHSFVGTIKSSFSSMTHWLSMKPKRYSEEFNVLPMQTDSLPSSNGRFVKTSRPGINRHFANHGFSIHHHTSQGEDMLSNGSVEDEVKNGVSQNISKHAPRSSSFLHRPSTASMCIRLKEKEEFKKLVQLQSQRSPWQQPVSFGIPNVSNANDSDIVSISSESSNDQHKRPTSQLMETKSNQSIFTIPRHKATPSSQSNSKSIQTKFLLNSLYERHQRYSMSISAKKPTLTAHDGHSYATPKLKDNSSKEPINTDKTLSQPSKHPDAVVVIDDDDDKSKVAMAESSFPTKIAAVTKEAQTHNLSDFRTKAAFLQSKFLNDTDIEDERRARIEEQKRRKLLIEEEEMKARAYEKKRRAQEISLDRSLKYQMRIFDDEPQVCEDIFREEEEEEEDKLPELTSEMQVVIDRALRPGPMGELLSEDFRLQITRADIVTLSGLNWLNDEVINFYMNLLMRSGENGERAKLYAFNTFFYPKIKAGGHSAVRRWTKSVNIFGVHYVVIPVHLGVHWCLCIADMEKKVITYYDSMGAKNNQCLQAVLQYLHDESIAKGYSAFKRNEWQMVNAEDNPQQMNGGDCGMFMCMYAEYITRGKEITFTQEHMPYFRRRMVYEIISKKLLQ